VVRLPAATNMNVPLARLLLLAAARQKTTSDGWRSADCVGQDVGGGGIPSAAC